VGGDARSDNDLLHTTIATSIVHQYLEILVGNARSAHRTWRTSTARSSTSSPPA
jgi:hypothetical protein